MLTSGSFIEGWAVHAEEIMARLGYGGVPVRLQQLKMQLRTTINALLDAGVHAGGMSEAEAMELMTVRGFQEEGEAVGKWRRALLTSAQLSTYFVGYLELAPTLAGLTRYDEVLAHGSPPPRHLPALLAAGRDGAAGNRGIVGMRPTRMRRLATAVLLAALPLAACPRRVALAPGAGPGAGSTGAGSGRPPRRACRCSAPAGSPATGTS